MPINPVFVYIPNLIGYGRIILALASLALMSSSSSWSIVLYGASCLLDAADGFAARYYGQSSGFGAVLDMVTDRCTTASLLVYLSLIYPSCTFCFQLLLSLDFSSHYLHMVASEKAGRKSHKAIDREGTPYLMYLYYTNRTVLFWVCFGNETFFMLLYCMAQPWPHLATLMSVLLLLSTPVMVFKQVMNVIQLVAASSALAQKDWDEALALQASHAVAETEKPSTRKSPRNLIRKTE
ncbi:CDP-diacylglycerol-inositol 3-phosphatidyltransferase [Kappamyces sp. JEL0829]|nr:CDP-diacylglycerol-inositol 3-phosphatidyltransferase [Kappamyces sp. JEL0829]